MNKQRTTFTKWLLAGLIAIGSQLLMGADLGFLVQDGEAKADIVISESSTRAARLAAKELQKYVEKISGAELPIGTKPSGDYANHVFVGPSAYAAEHGVTAEGLERSMFRMVSGPGWLALVGKDADFQPDPREADFTWDVKDPKQSWESEPQKRWEEITGESWVSPMGLFSMRPDRIYSKTLDLSMADEVGTLYAVNEFIRSLGVEWYLPGPSGEIVPERETIAIPAVDQTVKPVFDQRHIGFTAPRFDGERQINDILWYYRIGLGMGFSSVVNHTFQLVHGHPEAKTKYPKYFATFNGESGADVGRYGQATVSSPEFKDAMVRYARAVFDNYPWVESFSIAPTDGYWRIADQDADGVTPHRGTHGVMSDLIWGFVNDVAKEIKKSHPDKKIIGLAYSTYRLPPEKIDKLEDNVEVYICWPSRRRLGPDAEQKMDELREGWEKITAPGNLYSWDYYNHSIRKRATVGVPMIYPRSIAKDVQSVSGRYAGEFIESARHSNAYGESSDETAILLPGLNHLNAFVTARAYWDPDMDIEAVLTKYFRDFFGPAEAQMREFVEIAESGPWESWTPDQIKRLQELLVEAKEVAGDSIYGERINIIEIESKDRLAELLRVRSLGYEKTFPVVQAADDPEVLTAALEPAFRGQFPVINLEDPLSNPGARPPFGAQVGFGQTGKYFYLFANFESPKKQTSERKNDDLGIVDDDAVQFLIEPERGTQYLVAVNSSGALLDAQVTDENDLNADWNSGAEAAVVPTESGWSAVVRVPLDSLGGQGPTQDDYWRFNVARNIPDIESMSAVTVLVGNGTNDIVGSIQNSARLMPGAKNETFVEEDIENGMF